MRKTWETVKIKILLGYLFLVGIAAFTVWLIYSEIYLFSDNKTRISNLNNKILYFNSVLTNLYQAEALERIYSQTGNPVHYNNYERLMDVIYLQFDSLSNLSENPRENQHTDSIIHLLDKKRKNLKELIVIKRGTTDDLYERALDRFTINKDSINALLNTRKIITDVSESTYVEQKKKKFFERLMYAFSPKDEPDSILQVNKQQIIETDTIITDVNAADSVILFLTSILEDIRKENQDSELQLARKEREVLANDRTITLQLRQMLSIFEKEIFVNSLDELRTLQDRVKLTTWYLIALGALALFVISIFLILILKDITQSQRYRHELEEAKAFSDSLLKSKEQFMLSITHDIKSPIATVTGYARLLHETTDNQQKDYYLENINKSADHILKLIGDPVDLTRLETGKLKIENSRFNLFTTIKDISSGFFPLAFAKKLDFIVEFNVAKENEYNGDSIRLKQVLGNILSNAIKYTDSGKITLAISLEKTVNTTDFVRFDVIDTGIGISEEDSKLIFNEFTRVAQDHMERYEGVGLGLSIAQRLVSLLKGKITLISKPGMGSQFAVHLPLERYLQEIPAPITEEQTAEVKADSINILVIDDDEIFLNFTAEILQRTGIQVYKCSSAVQAIKLLEEHSADLIITDIQMPTMNGLDLLAYLQRKTGKHIPVIAVTGEAVLNPEGVTLAASLKKPFVPDELLGLVGKILQRRISSPVSALAEHSHSLDEKKSDEVGYTLDQIRQFALNDPQSIHRILTSFVESSYENLALFEKHVLEKDRVSLSELAHKMLAMFRQIEAEKIVAPLMNLERYDRLSDEEWEELGRQTFKKIERFIENICENHGIYIRM